MWVGCEDSLHTIRILLSASIANKTTMIIKRGRALDNAGGGAVREAQQILRRSVCLSWTLAANLRLWQTDLFTEPKTMSVYFS